LVYSATFACIRLVKFCNPIGDLKDKIIFGQILKYIMNTYLRLGLIVLCVSLIFGCKNDIDITADYKETSIVYGLLNQTDSVQYIKIYKTFLGDANAYQMATATDSFYHQNVLDVTIERWKNNSLAGIIQCVRDSSLPMDSGIFANAPNITYKSVGSDSIYADSDYRLVIRNTKTGLITYATTSVIDKFFTYNSVDAYVNMLQNPYKVIWFNARDGAFYRVKFKFHYAETNTITGITEYKILDWDLGEVLGSGLMVGDQLNVKIFPDDFYAYVGNKLAPLANTKRFAGKIDIEFVAGNQVLYDYYQVNNYGNSLALNNPTLTNVTNGLGVFGSRYVQTIYDRTLTQGSLDSLSFGRFTSDLGF
jgi:hypothetical protein